MFTILTLSTDDIITFKMVSSEEVIGRFKNEDDDFFYVSKPISLMPDPNNGRISFIHSMFSMDIDFTDRTPVPIRKSAVMMYTKTKDDLKKAYIDNTSIVKVAPKDILLG
jgi:hypothetical protein